MYLKCVIDNMQDVCRFCEHFLRHNYETTNSHIWAKQISRPLLTTKDAPVVTIQMLFIDKQMLLIDKQRQS